MSDTTTTREPLLAKLPEHKAALILTHNDHKSYYLTVQEAIDNGYHGYDCWMSEEQMDKAIATDECWTLQWYPDTPNGFRVVSAADLHTLLEYCSAPAADTIAT